ncbi:hemerythrin domain-containing protein [Helicobacter jaachi]|uniref:Hemerythrin domain-containing protein n=1 Tax=Helicobacter jaachi TaxID=1677920 RepID=A0A4V6I284_9HELI|nr:hemerythrin domain-containing protein [Helicobacter jaachi]TLD95112.1 hemerythrin domain-containing protein [Helicobacter jaachi]
MQIKDFMTNDHRACDEEFSKIEELVSEGEFESAKNAFEVFKAHTLKHFNQEENLLFIEFINATGMSGGPVEVMTYEHNQMRGLLAQLEAALEAKDSEAFFGTSEAMMIMLQQHNMKEEQMLYNMIQMHLGAQNDELVSKLAAM